MRDLLDDIDRWRNAGKRVAVARVVDTQGSGPRETGAAMAVNEDGEVIGYSRLLPTTRPHLPRISSSESGFFFCGMRLDPVVMQSDISTKPNSGVLQRTSSSERRERCEPIRAAAERNSTTKSRSDTASREFSHREVNLSFFCTLSLRIGSVVESVLSGTPAPPLAERGRDCVT